MLPLRVAYITTPCRGGHTHAVMELTHVMTPVAAHPMTPALRVVVAQQFPFKGYAMRCELHCAQRNGYGKFYMDHEAIMHVRCCLYNGGGLA